MKERVKFYKEQYLGSKGWRSGESARLLPMWPGFKSRRQRHLWVEFVVGSVLCSERFFPGTPVFPSLQKPTFPNSNSTRNQVDEEPLCDVLPPNHYLFVYLFNIRKLKLMVTMVLILVMQKNGLGGKTMFYISRIWKWIRPS